MSQAVEGFPALPFTARELDDSKAMLNGYQSTVLMDVTKTVFEQALKQSYNPVVQVAAHAKFGHNLDDSFIAFKGSRLEAKNLETLLQRFELSPLELLVLSACETAQGNDARSALGLAGLAAKTGAHNVIGSLRTVYDESTSILIPLFHHYSQQEGYSKAKALQSAQRDLFKRKGFHAPIHWSTFVLIGHG